jgi:hypothetical protein
VDADIGMRRVCRIVVPQLADWYTVDKLAGMPAGGFTGDVVLLAVRLPVLPTPHTAAADIAGAV